MKITRIGFAAVAAALVFVSASALRADTPGFYTLDGLLTKSWREVGPCDSFDSITYMVATTAGKHSGSPRQIVTPSFPNDEGDGTRTVIFQWVGTEKDFIKAVKVHLKIENGALHAKFYGNNSMYVAYVASPSNYPYDFNSNSYTTYGFVSSDSAEGGYNLQNLKVRVDEGPAPSGHYTLDGLVSQQWREVAPCDSFDSIVFPMSATAAGAASGTPRPQAEFTFFRDEGDGTRTAIFQWLDDKYIKAVKVAFKIEYGLLFVKLHGEKGMYVGNSNEFPYDFNTQTHSQYQFATDDSASGYGLQRLNVRVGGMLVTGEPGEYATPTPGYGDYTNWTARTVSTPATSDIGGVHAECAGYDVYYSPDHGASWTLAASGAASSTNDFDCVHVSGAVMPTKLVWRYNAGLPPGVDAPTLVANGTSSLTLSAYVTGIGYTASSATVKFAYGLSPEALNYTNTASTTATLFDTATGTISPLVPGRTYYVRAIVEPNEASPTIGESSIVSFRTSALPETSSGYIRLEYIQGDGAQWIDTGYYPTPSTRTVADYQIHTQVNKQDRVFSSNTGRLVYGVYVNGSGKWAYALNDNDGNWKQITSDGILADTARHVFDFNYANSAGKRCLTIDGGSVASVEGLEGSHANTASVAMAIGATRQGALTIDQRPPKHRIYSFRIYENPSYGSETIVRDYIPAMRSADSVCGLYDLVENKFYASFKRTASPTYTPLEYLGVGGPASPFTAKEVVANGDLASVALDFAASEAARTLKVAMGTAYGGDDPSAWAITDTVATITAGVTNATWSAPADWGEGQKALARFFFDDGATVADWSNTIYWHDLSEPLAEVVSLDGNGGDTIAVSGNLVSFPGADCALTVYTGDSDATATNAWTGLAGSVREAAGEFELTLFESDTTAPRYIVPGSTVYVAVEATSGGKTTRSEAVAVTMKSAPVFASTPTCSISHRTAAITATFYDFGECDEATITLYAGPAGASENELVAIEGPVTRSIANFGAVQFTHTFDGFNSNHVWQVRAYAVSEGETATNEVRSALATLKTVDNTDYYWRGDIASGDWNDPANWVPQSHAGDCIGYPDSTAAKARFFTTSAETGIVVNVNGKFTIGEFFPNDAIVNDITLVGSGRDASSLTVTSLMPSYGNWKDTAHDSPNGARYWPRSGTRLAFKDMTLSIGCDWEYIRSGSRAAGDVKNRSDVTDISLKFDNVAMTMPWKTFAFSTPYSRLEIVDSDLSIGKVTLGGTNTVVTLDNSRWATSDSFQIPQDGYGDMMLVFKGAAPQMTSANRFGTYNQTETCRVVFSIPDGGYAAAPINMSSSNNKFATPYDNVGTSQMTFEIDPKSPARGSARKIEKLLLVDTKKGFNETHTIDPVGAAGAVPLNPSGVPYGEFAWGKDGVTEGFTLSTAMQLWLLDFKGVGRTVFLVQ